MGGGGDISYESILMFALFLSVQWYVARIAMSFKVPTIPFDIIVGMLFGPKGLDLIGDFSHTYSPLQLLGFIGVGIVIFESGMHLDAKKVFNWNVGPLVFGGNSIDTYELSIYKLNTHFMTLHLRQIS